MQPAITEFIRITSAAIAVAVLGRGISTSALAQAPDPAERAARMLERMDENKDGHISENEFRGPPPIFERIDSNRDGALSKAELQSFRPPAGGRGFRGPKGKRGGGFRDRRFREQLAVGTPVPNLPVYGRDRKRVGLHSLLKDQYTVIVTGCLSCPRYLRSYQTVEAVAQDYRKKGVGFYYVYQTLAHPENHGYVNAFKIEERFMQIEHAERTLGTKISWVADTLQNDVKTFFAGTPNSMFVLDREGKIVFREPWSDGDQLRDALANLKGPAANPTDAADLKFPYIRPVNMRFEGVVARIRVDEPLNPVKFTPGASAENYYAKLKPEVSRALLSSGSGKI